MVKVNKHGTNVKIKAHILEEEKMRELGFTDFCEDIWYWHKTVGEDITFNLHIKKDGSDMWIDVLDEDFCQPYDYQHILERNPKLSFALEVKKKVKDIMTYLQEVGVLSGHEYGEYI